ncbi:hypothetical protein KEM56_001764, partial [Ascosphaera pollenicola]
MSPQSPSSSSSAKETPTHIVYERRPMRRSDNEDHHDARDARFETKEAAVHTVKANFYIFRALWECFMSIV